jgi:DNA repair protein RecO (recombination protein O)
MLKGILTSKKGGLKKSLFQPLNLINISTQIKNQSNQKLNFIREGSLNVHFKEIPLRIKKNAIALFISEVISRVIYEEGNPNIALYSFLENSIMRLEKDEFSPVFHLKFLTLLSDQLGFYPNLMCQEKEFFDIESGCFCENSNSKYAVGGETVGAFKELLGINFDDIVQIKISNTLRIKVLDFLIDYFNIHLPRFGKIKSIAVLHEIFH